MKSETERAKEMTGPPRLPFIQIKKENNSTRPATPSFRLILRLEYTSPKGVHGIKVRKFIRGQFLMIALRLHIP